MAKKQNGVNVDSLPLREYKKAMGASLTQPRHCKVIGITGALEGEEKSTAAPNPGPGMTDSDFRKKTFKARRKNQNCNSCCEETGKADTL